jgi:hypothetical protein
MNKTMSLSAMRAKFGSAYHVSKILGISQGAISRWKRVPDHHLARLHDHPGGRLKRGGLRK